MAEYSQGVWCRRIIKIGEMSEHKGAQISKAKIGAAMSLATRLDS
jgi:hypothetical protein